jgi:cytochrome c oxidase subunit 2
MWSCFTFLPFLFLSGCFEVVPMTTVHPVTEAGRDINYVYALTTIITVFIFLAVAIPIIIALVRFRERPDDDGSIPEQVHGNVVLEFIWTIVPIILLIVIALPTWQIIFKQAAAASDKALRVEVVGHQWWWEFRYPDLGMVIANELYLPENTEIDLVITSNDVLHSFWVPRFGGKVDCVPGHLNTLKWTTPPAANSGGDYYQGQCVELCGLSHALMRFKAAVLKADEWQRWVEAYKEPPVMLTSLEKQGAKIFNMQCASCHTINGTPSAELDIVKLGPNLTNFGDRKKIAAGTMVNNMENLKKWISNPGKVKPGVVKMVPYEDILSPQEIEAVSSYIRNSTVRKF